MAMTNDLYVKGSNLILPGKTKPYIEGLQTRDVVAAIIGATVHEHPLYYCSALTISAGGLLSITAPFAGVWDYYVDTDDLSVTLRNHDGNRIASLLHGDTTIEFYGSIDGEYNEYDFRFLHGKLMGVTLK